jgi:serine/threonine protein kinase
MLYYSPEIITGKKYHGPEVDCWCLGITLFRMTAGFEPFSHAHSKQHGFYTYAIVINVFFFFFFFF